jgi:hypothetical protein
MVHIECKSILEQIGTISEEDVGLQGSNFFDRPT